MCEVYSGRLETPQTKQNHSNETCANAGHTGPCIYFFGSPLPLRAGGVSTCILNEISGPVTGTININDGTSTTNVPLSSKVHPVGTEFAPCPRCESGTCQDGPRITQACSVNGTGIFGDVSLDCPPNSGSLAGALRSIDRFSRMPWIASLRSGRAAATGTQIL